MLDDRNGGCSYNSATVALMPTKGDVLRFRVTTAEKTRIERAAAREHMSTSVWLRRLALDAAGVPTPITIVSPETGEAKTMLFTVSKRRSRKDQRR